MYTEQQHSARLRAIRVHQTWYMYLNNVDVARSILLAVF